MAIGALIRGHCSTDLWGLNSHTRLHRQLRAVGDIELLDEVADARNRDLVLLLRAGFLFELRTLQGLMGHPKSVLICPRTGQQAAAYIPGQDVADFISIFDNNADISNPSYRTLAPGDLNSFDGELRRVEAPLLEPIAADQQAALESRLYGNAYKGITDLVTKWWWPKPARAIVAWCANSCISPNAVTAVGVALVILSCVLFAHGYFVAGLLSGWLMTLLDTVDGKLARVTVQSSRIGHVMDHGTDIIHPPFWYVFWAQGLNIDGSLGGLSYEQIVLAILVAYVGGRIIEGVFELLARCSMFAWRPWDAYFRLVTARRNPCLIILTVPTLFGRPDWGLIGVIGWSALSSLLLAGRFVYAVFLRATGQRLESWLADPEHAKATNPRAYYMFSGTRGAYE